MTLDLTVVRLQTEEGFRATAYRDTTGNLTIGYGFNIDAGISRAAALALLQAQVSEIQTELMQQPWFLNIADNTRQSALLDMAFNLGLAGLVNGFPKMIACIQADDWIGAAAQCHVTNQTLDNGRYAVLRRLLLIGGIE